MTSTYSTTAHLKKSDPAELAKLREHLKKSPFETNLSPGFKGRWESQDASANLMKERRLAFVAREKSLQDRAVRGEEQRLSRTQDVLGKLGAGQPYGE